MTNTSAATALATLRTINGQLHRNQAMVSSGYRISSATDNAGYWSISTTMRSDASAMSAAQDAMAFGAAKIDTAYAGIEATIAVVDAFKVQDRRRHGIRDRQDEGGSYLFGRGKLPDLRLEKWISGPRAPSSFRLQRKLGQAFEPAAPPRSPPRKYTQGSFIFALTGRANQKICSRIRRVWCSCRHVGQIANNHI
ncbi:hypothetical protein [Agrobacterium tumefaciens]|uniref:flagellin N-terminal helical domain-containing protein n=1 Tax=Agrobacterium tumefaciens TaxID=358 RepID=UPI001CBB8CF6|nr:hypothetical protein [Agrobacterium tumefaciens]